MPKPSKNAAAMPDGFNAAIRAFMAENGTPISEGSSYYNGFEHGMADLHTHSEFGECSWIVPEGVLLTETIYTVWGGTFGGDSREVGIDVVSTDAANIHCACNQFQNMSLRFVGTFGDVLLGALSNSPKLSDPESGQPGIVI